MTLVAQDQIHADLLEALPGRVLRPGDDGCADAQPVHVRKTVRAPCFSSSAVPLRVAIH
jgi:hypothetical protein